MVLSYVDNYLLTIETKASSIISRGLLICFYSAQVPNYDLKQLYEKYISFMNSASKCRLFSAIRFPSLLSGFSSCAVFFMDSNSEPHWSGRTRVITVVTDIKYGIIYISSSFILLDDYGRK